MRSIKRAAGGQAATAFTPVDDEGNPHRLQFLLDLLACRSLLHLLEARR